jgi:hypothetical protein
MKRTPEVLSELWESWVVRRATGECPDFDHPNRVRKNGSC